MERIFLGMPPIDIELWMKEHAATDGNVIYKTGSSAGRWLRTAASISNGEFAGFNGKSSAVEVLMPSKDANGSPVTSIALKAFYQCYYLEHVSIGQHVASIGARAFSYCSQLKSIDIPDSTTTIGQYAFEYCTSLERLAIGKGTTTIIQAAFINCSDLKYIAMPDTVTTIGTWAFSACNSIAAVRIFANGGNAQNVKSALIAAGVPSSVTWIMP